MSYKIHMGKAEFEKSLHTLMGLMRGIKIDHELNVLEVEELQHWVTLQMPYRNRSPYNEIIPRVLEYLEDGILSADEVEDIDWLCNQYLNINPYFDTITRDIQILHGMLHGILSDNVITEEELSGLKSWMNDHDHLETVYPYDEIYSVISAIMQDHVIDDQEQQILRAVFSEFIEFDASHNLNRSEYDDLRKSMTVQGICALGPNIELNGKLFCFTGESSRTKRSEIASIITSRGGQFNNNVVSNTDFLIVGDNGNPCWAFSCYGRKIEKAIDLRKKGKRIIIAHEIDFWEAL